MKLKLCLLTCAIGLSACSTVGPDYKAPEPEINDQWVTDTSKTEVKESTVPEAHSEWWNNFNDPVLNRLIDMAYQQNLTLQIAGLRVHESRAILGFAAGSLYPQSQGLNASAAKISLSENADPIDNLPGPIANQIDTSFKRFGAGFDAAWELDFWGKFQRGVEAADAGLAASLANYDNMLVTITGEIASMYTIMRSMEERLAIAESNVKIQTRSMEIASVRYKNGLVTELDVQLSKSLLNNTKARIPMLRAKVRQTRMALSQLLGMPPSDLTEIIGEAGTIPTMSEQLTLGVPADLLRRRPDIRQMELLAAAQSARIGIAEADLYPALRLAGTVGYSASTSGDVVDSNSGFGLMLLSVDWKILNYGRLKSRIRMEDARFQQAITAYQNSVLNAAREVESSLTGYTHAKEQVDALTKSVAASKRAVELAQTQYRDGIISYTLVLDSQQFLLLNEDALTRARSSVSRNLIATYKALGGGWQKRENNPLISTDMKQQMESRTNWGELLTPESIKPVPENERGSWRLPDL